MQDHASEIFFPARIALRIDGSSASPAVLEKKVSAAAHAPSYAIGGLLLRTLGGIDLSGRGLNKTTVKIGTELVAHRDARLAAYFNQPLPRKHALPTTPISLDCVSLDGGRMQTRTESGGLQSASRLAGLLCQSPANEDAAVHPTSQIPLHRKRACSSTQQPIAITALLKLHFTRWEK